MTRTSKSDLYQYLLSTLMITLTGLSLMFTFCLSTSCSTQVKNNDNLNNTNVDGLERMIEQNRAVLLAEREDIQIFVDSSEYPFQKNGLGMQIAIIENGRGRSLDTGDVIKIKSKVMSLNGHEFYNYDFIEFSILRDNKMIWGVQEATLGSKRGDSLILVIPAHLAHGLAGDLNTIPPLTPLVYYLRIL